MCANNNSDNNHVSCESAFHALLNLNFMTTLESQH